MVAIRLSRVGKKGHATFRFVASDKRRDLYGPALEILGSYDPHTNPATVHVKGDRIQYWLSKGAQASASVHNLLITAGVIKGEKVVVAKAPKKDEPKAEEKKAEAPPAKPDPATPEKVEEKPAAAPQGEGKTEAEQTPEKPEEVKA